MSTIVTIALTSDGIFNILFGIIFLVLFLALAILLFVQIVLFIQRKNRIKLEILIVLFCFCIINCFGLSLRIASFGSYLTPDYFQQPSLQLFSIITAIPNRPLTTTFTLFFSLLLCVCTVQLFRIANMLQPKIINLILSTLVICMTLLYCCFVLITCIVMLTEYIIYAVTDEDSLNQMDNIYTYAPPISAILLYTTIPIFILHASVLVIIFVGIVLWLGIRFEKLKKQFIQLLIQRTELFATELQEINQQQLLDLILLQPMMEEGASMSGHSSLHEIQTHFKKIQICLVKCSLLIAFVCVMALIFLCMSVLVALGVKVWNDVYKIVHVINRLLALAIIVGALLAKEWFSWLFKEAFYLKKVMVPNQVKKPILPPIAMQEKNKI